MSIQLKKHVCTHEGCSQSFDRPFKLTQHLLFHNNVKAYTCKEADCSKSYTSKSHLDRHIRSVHKVTRSNIIYSCPKCLKTYSNRQNLKKHIKVIHDLEVPFLCDHCTAKFKKKNQLSAHMYKHTGIKSFSCDMCPAEFITLYEKKRHLRYHKIYTCDICTAVFNHWSKYQKHKKTGHNTNEFICNDCGRKFNQRTHIVRHIKSHYGDVVKKNVICPYEGCRREYSRSTFLRHHIITKHEKCKLKCSVCQGDFATKAKLNLHMKLHNKSETELKQKKPRVIKKERKDKGSMKTSTAMKLAGLPTQCKEGVTPTRQNITNSSIDCVNKTSVEIALSGADEAETALKSDNMLIGLPCKDDNKALLTQNRNNLPIESEDNMSTEIVASEMGDDNTSVKSDNMPIGYPCKKDNTAMTQNTTNSLMESEDKTSTALQPIKQMIIVPTAN